MFFRKEDHFLLKVKSKDYWRVSIARRILSADPKAKALPQESTAQYLSFEWSHFWISFTDSEVRVNFVQNSKQHHRKVLLSSFHVNGHTEAFHLYKLKLDCLLEAHGFL